MKYYNLLSLIIFLFLVSSCKKQDIPHKPKPSPFSVSVQDQSKIPFGGGQKIVDIKAGADGWWIVIPPDATWCTSSQLFGSGDKTITLKFSKNTTSANRSVTVEFNPTFDLPKEEITFEQE